MKLAWAKKKEKIIDKSPGQKKKIYSQGAGATEENKIE